MATKLEHYQRLAILMREPHTAWGLLGYCIAGMDHQQLEELEQWGEELHREFSKDARVFQIERWTKPSRLS